MKKSILYKLSLFFILFTACNKKDNVTTPEPYTPITINSDWFNVSYINPKTYSLEEPKSSQHNVSYIIVGDSKALMFDTGSGENQPINGLKIKPIIEQLSQVPTTLLLSHFHFDHNQNISEFNSVGFPDLPFLRQNVTPNGIYNFTDDDLFLGSYPSQVQVNEWQPLNTDIDLGNRIIQIINIPGHTNESIAIIDKTNKMAFLGDYLYNGSLFLFNNNDIAMYKESVNYLISTLNDDYKLFGAHGTPEIAYEKLERLKSFLVCIESNSCQSTATNIWGFDVLIYEFENMQIVIFQ
ncbi:MBL fold metallo-hydrolase [Maribacter sp.]|uniref:MBL fold metallo-hydrolase n=1 Tax=Maribacter sp. TaxID=1897614 RepID=UPI0025C5A355|nr:MBL fold metallo-hydrolase [Maribacter sp.]